MTSTVQYRLSSVSYNGVQNAGALLSSVGFNAYYVSTVNPAPTITTILFNGINVCSNGKQQTRLIYYASLSEIKFLFNPRIFFSNYNYLQPTDDNKSSDNNQAFNDNCYTIDDDHCTVNNNYHQTSSNNCQWL